MPGLANPDFISQGTASPMSISKNLLPIEFDTAMSPNPVKEEKKKLAKLYNQKDTIQKTPLVKFL